MSETVAVEELRIGMYIHLDLGWMAHPFPVSSFRITAAEQIATIRELGLKQLRWVPEKSLPLEPAAAAGSWTMCLDPQVAPRDGSPTAGEHGEVISEERRQRERLAAQRASALVCERQYGEAGRAWRDASDAVLRQPEQARQASEALAGALLDKMLIDGEMSIRLLSSGAGDRATAHALNVSVISLLMGRSMGLTRVEMLDLGVGALMHDVGKLDVPDRLRHLEEGLSASETQAYREHVARGVVHGRRMGLQPGALLVLAQHHELADATGFPLRLPADRTSLAARIVALVNRYDNLCNPAQMARALTPHEALSTLFAQSRAKFDAVVLNSFIRMMGVYPAGSLVQLTDDRYAMVMSVNSSRPMKPRVLVHNPKGQKSDGLFLNLEAMADLGIRRSLNPAKLPREALEYLSPRPRVSYFFEPTPAEERMPASEALA